MNYTGNRLPATITQSNAAELAFRVISVRELTQFAEAQWTDPPQAPAEGEETQTGRFGGTATVRIDLDASGRGYIEAVFDDYSDDPDEVINGRFLQRLRPAAGVPAGLDYSFAGPGSLEFDGFSVSVGQDELLLQGVVEIQGLDSNTFLVDLIASQGPTGESLYFEDVTLRFSEVSVAGVPRPAIDLSGTVFEETDGAVDFISLGPIPDLGANEWAGYVVGGAGGGLHMQADGPATHFRPISFAFASIIMDLDGDGTPETARRYSWPELNGETVVESSVFAGPIANTANRRSVFVGDRTSLHGLFSHDDDGDWLTFDWSLVSKPLFSSAQIDGPTTQPLIEFIPDEPGDYVFRLRVSDGIDAGDMWLVVRAEPEGTFVDQRPLAGALEIGQPIATSTPILIDARSALQWPYGQGLPSWARTGFGAFSFSDTGNPSSTYLSVGQEGINEILFRQNSDFTGAPASSAEVRLAVGPAVFETRTQVPGEPARDLHKLDYDGDGDADLAIRVGGPGAARLRILLSTPDGFLPGPDVAVGAGEVAPGDLDLDGRMDFLHAGDEGLLMLRQLPDGSLSETLRLDYPAAGCASGGGPTDVGLIDVDGAGGLDAAAVHPCGDGIVTWLQESDGTFTSPTVISFDNHRILSAAFGDVNGDGRADYAVSLLANTTDFDSGVSILATQPDGTVSQLEFIVNDSIGAQGVAIGDVDADARNDIVVVNYDEIVLLKGQAGGAFVRETVFTDPESPPFQPAVSLVDVNDDGLKDVYFCTTGPDARLLLQEPDGRFGIARGPRCTAFDLDQPEIAVAMNWNGTDETALVTLAESALLDVYLQGAALYPVPVAE
ncbi:FG-GAP repeat domain-containing protein [Lentisalinibacter sediminis]|uniref:FG-GAP repeat domain-containing protein n=1 Tax=Lentisalinibacter sediminis TaxID=2992237 RepID=UPI0038684B5E